MTKTRSPVDIMADFRMLRLNNFKDHEEVKKLRRDVKVLLKNMREYVAYLVESGQSSLTEAVDKDILEFEDVSKRLHSRNSENNPTPASTTSDPKRLGEEAE